MPTKSSPSPPSLGSLWDKEEGLVWDYSKCAEYF